MATQKTSIMLGRVLSVALALIILGTLGYFSYIIAVPQFTKPFTEFYILGASGKAGDYPKELKVGEKTTLTLGIINREKEETSYTVEVRVGGVTTSQSEPIDLEHGGKYEQVVSFVPAMAGDNQAVEFLLYKQGQPAVYESLILWVDVSK